ncbi:unnamed protein product [Periconia digitata]|uniref:Secreted protein n=1 Tax=Periconia digitata TaxID=1303443 RepID=A0A9W4XDP7_9PLEO|nr:unnamed protein product [Periconia digitata]
MRLGITLFVNTFDIFVSAVGNMLFDSSSSPDITLIASSRLQVTNFSRKSQAQPTGGSWHCHSSCRLATYYSSIW